MVQPPRARPDEVGGRVGRPRRRTSPTGRPSTARSTRGRGRTTGRLVPDPRRRRRLAVAVRGRGCAIAVHGATSRSTFASQHSPDPMPAGIGHPSVVPAAARGRDPRRRGLHVQPGVVAPGRVPVMVPTTCGSSASWPTTSTGPGRTSATRRSVPVGRARAADDDGRRRAVPVHRRGEPGRASTRSPSSPRRMRPRRSSAARWRARRAGDAGPGQSLEIGIDLAFETAQLTSTRSSRARSRSLPSASESRHDQPPSSGHATVVDRRVGLGRQRVLESDDAGDRPRRGSRSPGGEDRLLEPVEVDGVVDVVHRVELLRPDGEPASRRVRAAGRRAGTRPSGDVASGPGTPRRSPGSGSARRGRRSSPSPCGPSRRACRPAG